MRDEIVTATTIKLLKKRLDSIDSKASSREATELQRSSTTELQWWLASRCHSPHLNMQWLTTARRLSSWAVPRLFRCGTQFLGLYEPLLVDTFKVSTNATIAFIFLQLIPLLTFGTLIFQKSQISDSPSPQWRYERSFVQGNDKISWNRWPDYDYYKIFECIRNLQILWLSHDPWMLLEHLL
jgi:hypothetical protein